MDKRNETRKKKYSLPSVLGKNLVRLEHEKRCVRISKEKQYVKRSCEELQYVGYNSITSFPSVSHSIVRGKSVIGAQVVLGKNLVRLEHEKRGARTSKENQHVKLSCEELQYVGYNSIASFPSVYHSIVRGKSVIGAQG
ncbi:hypothetical protein CDAR_192291 [Caerostris darwini]|uniref:Ribosomal protein S4 n=1 Tax=Caerostris darwini TaxID=1538125 RepID=A0AAV4TTA9_9ARAC|nr:hypothetical protein CDAR_192291 [Caerostris darwini]